MTQQLSGAQRHWTEADIPDLSGRTALVTGANTGLGLQTSRVLAARGAHVVLACRNLDKAGHAASQIAAAFPGASTSTVRLDLTSQSGVRSAAGEIRARFPHLDLLVNNAGVMEVPCQRTEDGFELTLATNHLGPFALTGLLLDRLAAGARIVPGDRLDMEARVIKHKLNIGWVACAASVDGKPVVSAELIFSISVDPSAFAHDATVLHL